jgi:hypothetical protein
LELETKEALASQDWLNISSESMLDFLNMECLNINEAALVRALIRWGKYQLQQQDKGVENLRSLILPGLRKIRFDSLTHQEVAQLCKEELGEVLTGDEKCSVLVSIITGDWKMMPTDFVSSSKLIPRHGPYTLCPLFFDTIPAEIANIRGPLSFTFQVDKKADIIGVKLNLSAYLHDTLTSIKLYTMGRAGEWTFIGTGDSKSMSLHRGEMFYKIVATQSLAANTDSKLTFTFATSHDGFLLGEDKTYTTYVLRKDKNPSCSDGLTLKVHNADLRFYVHIQGIVFDKVRSPIL